MILRRNIVANLILLFAVAKNNNFAIAQETEVAEETPENTDPTPSPTDFVPDINDLELETTNAYGNPNPKQGPWPECVGWQGEDCKAYILSEVEDTPEIDIIKPGTPDIHRVFMIVDEYNVIVKIPHRG